MTVRTKLSLITILLVFAIGSFPASVSASGNPSSLLELSELASIIDADQNQNGGARVPRELQVVDLVSLPIIQQPTGNVTFVSSLQDYVTEFQTASRFGTVGLLAHNYLAGQYFSQILPGQQIGLVYSDQSIKKFIVTEVQKYQALTPDSPSSNFIDLATGEQLTATQLFRKTYGSQPGRLILQTCIFENNNPSWGRLFIIAKSVDQVSTKK